MFIDSDHAQANVFLQTPGAASRAEVTFGLDISAYGGGPSDAAQEVWDAWVGNMLTVQSHQWGITKVAVKFGPNDTGLDGEFISFDTGADAGQSVEPGVSVLLTKSTALGGRHNKGRMYMPGGPDDSCDANGVWDTGYLNDVTTAAAGLLSSLVGSDLPMALLHAESSPSPLLILSLMSQSVAATQRRRQRR